MRESTKVDPRAVRIKAYVFVFIQEEGICGVTQLYTERQDLSECIAAHVVTFCECLLEGNKTPSTLMCVATRDPDTNIGKVRVSPNV